MREGKVTAKDTVKLGKIAESSPKAAKNVLDQIKKAPTPKAASAIIREAHSSLPKNEEQRPQRPPLVLTNLEPDNRDEEIITSDGQKIYVLHRPKTKSVLNRTNDAVDWAYWTWNPVTGCWHGCNYCYARAIANDEKMAKVYPYKFELVFHPSRLKAPFNM